MVFVTILVGLLPSFLMVALGGVIRGRLSANAWQGLDKLNFEILFPALVFSAAASRPIAVEDIVAIGPAVWTILLAGLALGWLTRPLGPRKPLDFAGAWQTAWRFNTALGFVAVEMLSRGGVGHLAIAIGLSVPLANVFAATALSRGNAIGRRETLRRIALNPFLIASIAGVAVGVSGVTIPGPIMAPVNMVAQAALPIALISIGATMKWNALARLDGFAASLAGIRLLAVPALTYAACRLLGTDVALASVLVMFAALPTASAAHVLASAFGADRELVATLIAQMTLLSAISLPLWITVIELGF